MNWDLFYSSILDHYAILEYTRAGSRPCSIADICTRTNDNDTREWSFKEFANTEHELHSNLFNDFSENIRREVLRQEIRVDNCKTIQEAKAIAKNIRSLQHDCSHFQMSCQVQGKCMAKAVCAHTVYPSPFITCIGEPATHSMIVNGKTICTSIPNWIARPEFNQAVIMPAIQMIEASWASVENDTVQMFYVDIAKRGIRHESASRIVSALPTPEIGKLAAGAKYVRDTYKFLKDKVQFAAHLNVWNRLGKDSVLMNFINQHKKYIQHDGPNPWFSQNPFSEEDNNSTTLYKHTPITKRSPSPIATRNRFAGLSSHATIMTICFVGLLATSIVPVGTQNIYVKDNLIFEDYGMAYVNPQQVHVSKILDLPWDEELKLARLTIDRIKDRCDNVVAFPSAKNAYQMLIASEQPMSAFDAYKYCEKRGYTFPFLKSSTEMRIYSNYMAWKKIPSMWASFGWSHRNATYASPIEPLKPSGDYEVLYPNGQLNKKNQPVKEHSLRSWLAGYSKILLRNYVKDDLDIDLDLCEDISLKSVPGSDAMSRKVAEIPRYRDFFTNYNERDRKILTSNFIPAYFERKFDAKGNPDIRKKNLLLCDVEKDLLHFGSLHDVKKYAICETNYRYTKEMNVYIQFKNDCDKVVKQLTLQYNEMVQDINAFKLFLEENIVAGARIEAESPMFKNYTLLPLAANETLHDIGVELEKGFKLSKKQLTMNTRLKEIWSKKLQDSQLYAPMRTELEANGTVTLTDTQGNNVTVKVVPYPVNTNIDDALLTHQGDPIDSRSEQIPIDTEENTPSTRHATSADDVAQPNVDTNLPMEPEGSGDFMVDADEYVDQEEGDDITHFTRPFDPNAVRDFDTNRRSNSDNNVNVTHSSDVNTVNTTTASPPHNSSTDTAQTRISRMSSNDTLPDETDNIRHRRSTSFNDNLLEPLLGDFSVSDAHDIADTIEGMLKYYNEYYAIQEDEIMTVLDATYENHLPRQRELKQFLLNNKDYLNPLKVCTGKSVVPRCNEASVQHFPWTTVSITPIQFTRMVQMIITDRKHAVIDPFFRNINFNQITYINYGELPTLTRRDLYWQLHEDHENRQGAKVYKVFDKFGNFLSLFSKHFGEAMHDLETYGEIESCFSDATLIPCALKDTDGDSFHADYGRCIPVEYLNMLRMNMTGNILNVDIAIRFLFAPEYMEHLAKRAAQGNFKEITVWEETIHELSKVIRRTSKHWIKYPFRGSYHFGNLEDNKDNFDSYLLPTVHVPHVRELIKVLESKWYVEKGLLANHIRATTNRNIRNRIKGTFNSSIIESEEQLMALLSEQPIANDPNLCKRVNPYIWPEKVRIDSFKRMATVLLTKMVHMEEEDGNKWPSHLFQFNYRQVNFINRNFPTPDSIRTHMTNPNITCISEGIEPCPEYQNINSTKRDKCVRLIHMLDLFQKGSHRLDEDFVLSMIQADSDAATIINARANDQYMALYDFLNIFIITTAENVNFKFKHNSPIMKMARRLLRSMFSRSGYLKYRPHFELNVFERARNPYEGTAVDIRDVLSSVMGDKYNDQLRGKIWLELHETRIAIPVFEAHPYIYNIKYHRILKNLMHRENISLNIDWTIAKQKTQLITSDAFFKALDEAHDFKFNVSSTNAVKISKDYKQKFYTNRWPTPRFNDAQYKRDMYLEFFKMKANDTHGVFYLGVNIGSDHFPDPRLGISDQQREPWINRHVTEYAGAMAFVMDTRNNITERIALLDYTATRRRKFSARHDWNPSFRARHPLLLRRMHARTNAFQQDWLGMDQFSTYSKRTQPLNEHAFNFSKPLAQRVHDVIYGPSNRTSKIHNIRVKRWRGGTLDEPQPFTDYGCMCPLCPSWAQLLLVLGCLAEANRRQKEQLEYQMPSFQAPYSHGYHRFRRAFQDAPFWFVGQALHDVFGVALDEGQYAEATANRENMEKVERQLNMLTYKANKSERRWLTHNRNLNKLAAAMVTNELDLADIKVTMNAQEFLRTTMDALNMAVQILTRSYRSVSSMIEDAETIILYATMGMTSSRAITAKEILEIQQVFLDQIGRKLTFNYMTNSKVILEDGVMRVDFSPELLKEQYALFQITQIPSFQTTIKSDNTTVIEKFSYAKMPKYIAKAVNRNKYFVLKEHKFQECFQQKSCRIQTGYKRIRKRECGIGWLQFNVTDCDLSQSYKLRRERSEEPMIATRGNVIIYSAPYGTEIRTTCWDRDLPEEISPNGTKVAEINREYYVSQSGVLRLAENCKLFMKAYGIGLDPSDVKHNSMLQGRLGHRQVIIGNKLPDYTVVRPPERENPLMMERLIADKIGQLDLEDPVVVEDIPYIQIDPVNYDTPYNPRQSDTIKNWFNTLTFWDYIWLFLCSIFFLALLGALERYTPVFDLARYFLIKSFRGLVPRKTAGKFKIMNINDKGKDGSDVAMLAAKPDPSAPEMHDTMAIEMDVYNPDSGSFHNKKDDSDSDSDGDFRGNPQSHTDSRGRTYHKVEVNMIRELEFSTSEELITGNTFMNTYIDKEGNKLKVAARQRKTELGSYVSIPDIDYDGPRDDRMLKLRTNGDGTMRWIRKDIKDIIKVPANAYPGYNIDNMNAEEREARRDRRERRLRHRRNKHYPNIEDYDLHILEGSHSSMDDIGVGVKPRLKMFSRAQSLDLNTDMDPDFQASLQDDLGYRSKKSSTTSKSEKTASDKSDSDELTRSKPIRKGDNSNLIRKAVLIYTPGNSSTEASRENLAMSLKRKDSPCPWASEWRSKIGKRDTSAMDTNDQVTQTDSSPKPPIVRWENNSRKRQLSQWLSMPDATDSEKDIPVQTKVDKTDDYQFHDSSTNFPRKIIKSQRKAKASSSSENVFNLQDMRKVTDLIETSEKLDGAGPSNIKQTGRVAKGFVKRT